MMHVLPEFYIGPFFQRFSKIVIMTHVLPEVPETAAPSRHNDVRAPRVPATGPFLQPIRRITIITHVLPENHCVPSWHVVQSPMKSQASNREIGDHHG